MWLNIGKIDAARSLRLISNLRAAFSGESNSKEYLMGLAGLAYSDDEKARTRAMVTILRD